MTAKTYTVSTPARGTLNDHVDYWNGIGIGIALKSGLTVKYTPDTETSDLYIKSNNYSGMVTRNTGDEPLENKSKAWTNYVSGVFYYLNKFGVNAPGGKVEIKSDIPMGGGVSSSAALIVATMSAALRPFYNENEIKGKPAGYLMTLSKIEELVHTVLGNVGEELDKNHHTEATRKYSNKLRDFFLSLDAETGLKYIIALLAHRVETEYVGASCGRLDQMSCALAEPGQAIRINFDDLSYQPLPALPKGWELIVVDSGQKHKLVDPNSPYRKRFNAPQKEMMPFLGISSIQDVTDFKGDRAKIEKKYSPEYARWFEHAYMESKRGDQMADALRKGDVSKLATLMNASHHSLSVTYENSTPLIDSMITEVLANQSAEAGRIVGGGKGGSLVMLVQSDKAADACKTIDTFRKAHAVDIKGEKHHSQGVSFIETPPDVLKSLRIPASGRGVQV